MDLLGDCIGTASWWRPKPAQTERCSPPTLGRLARRRTPTSGAILRCPEVSVPSLADRLMSPPFSTRLFRPRTSTTYTRRPKLRRSLPDQLRHLLAMSKTRGLYCSEGAQQP